MSKTVSLDARKMVKFINESAQSNVALFEGLVQKLGERAERNYRLVALHNNSLMFEDVENGQYFLAKHDRNKKSSKIHITDITRVSVKESKKGHVFANACCELVGAICEGDTKAVDAAFRKLDSCRYRSTVASGEGYVTTRDGIQRRIPIDTQIVSEDSKAKIIDAVLKAISDDVVLEEGNVVSASLGDGSKMTLPITEMDRRRLVAKKMKAVAEDAWRSSAFQKFVKGIAAKVSEDTKESLREAVVASSKFLQEYQEFCMLTPAEMHSLVESALATQNIYNHILVENTAVTLYRSNVKVNRSEILEAWEKTAKLAANATLLEGVENLKSSDSFEGDYEQFLVDVLTEDMETQRKAFLNSLAVIRKTLEAEAGADDASVSQVDELIGRLSNEDSADTSALNEAAELLASLDKSIVDLGSFDAEQAPSIDLGEIAGEEGLGDEEGMPAPEGEEEGAGAAGLEMGGEDLGDLGDLESEEGLEGEGEEGPEGEGVEGDLDLSFDEEGEEGDEELDELEGETKPKAKAKKKSKEAEEALLAASRVVPVEEMGLEVLQEEFKTWQDEVNVYVASHGVEKVHEDLARYVSRCKELENESLAEQFNQLATSCIQEAAPSDDAYTEFDISEDGDINLDYGVVSEGGKPWENDDKDDDKDDDEADDKGKKDEPFGGKKAPPFSKKDDKNCDDNSHCEDEDQDGEPVSEAQRKSPNNAKSRTAPTGSTSKPLMKEGDEDDDKQQVDEAVAVVKGDVAVAAGNADDLSAAIDEIFGASEGPSEVEVADIAAGMSEPEEPVAVDMDEEPEGPVDDEEGAVPPVEDEEDEEGVEESKNQDTPAVTEDGDITDPAKNGSYENDDATRKWADGSKRNPKPKLGKMNNPSSNPVKSPPKSAKPKFGKGPFTKEKK